MSDEAVTLRVISDIEYEGPLIAHIFIRIMKELGIEPSGYIEMMGRKMVERPLIARIPIRIMKKLGIEPGGYIEITGRKTVYAQAWPVDSLDENKDVIVLNKTMRQEVGELSVKVRKADLKPAKRVVLASTGPVDIEHLKRVLLDKPIGRGQLFRVGSTEFVALQVQPEPAAYIVASTEILLKGADE